jgi:hypothetical protein
MTYNVDEGTDYLEVGAATSAQQFLVAVGQTISQVRATDPPARMQAVAKDIIAASPTLVSLQELDQWFTGPFDPRTKTCGSMTLEFDMLQELMTALAAEGGQYEEATQVQQFAFPPTPGLIAPSTFVCVQVVNYNAILARTDLPPSNFSWGNPQGGQFVTRVALHTPIGSIPIPRAWASVDVEFRNTSFRFVGTHLETLDATIREAQGAELRSGPANIPLPVIVAMDANAQAAPPPIDPTYTDFIGAGYIDTWAEVHPDDSGFTCCQAPLVNNAVSQLFKREDLILSLGSVEAKRAAVFGADPSDKTADGLWPSDHAAVVTALTIEHDDPDAQ